jgi:hypothetical protein
VVALVDHGGRLDDLEVVGIQAVGQPSRAARRRGRVRSASLRAHVFGVLVGRQGLALVAGDVGDQVARPGMNRLPPA